VKEIAPLLWIVAIAAIFWLLIIRPAQRRQREISQVQSSLVVGDTVVLSSGIFGTISQIDDATVLVEIAPGVDIKVARGAVGSVIRDDEPEAPEELEEPTSEDVTASTDDDHEER
jgi:preprotein translocase subunit YajC